MKNKKINYICLWGFHILRNIEYIIVNELSELLLFLQQTGYDHLDEKGVEDIMNFELYEKNILSTREYYEGIRKIIVYKVYEEEVDGVLYELNKSSPIDHNLLHQNIINLAYLSLPLSEDIMKYKRMIRDISINNILHTVV